MQYRRLGRLPFQVSEIGLGTAQLSNTDGRFQGVKPVSLGEARSILSVAIEQGVNFFDTADGYGNAEVLLGELTPATKQKVMIATKAGRRLDGVRDFSEPYLRQQVDRSLARLGVDCLALFQLNKPEIHPLKDGSLFSLLESLKRAGKIRYAGVVVGDLETADLCLGAGCVDCIQVLYHLLYGPMEEVIRRAKERGMGVIVRSPLNSGLLSGAYTPQTVFSPEDERSQYFSGKSFEDRLNALRRIQQDLHVGDADLLEFSLRYVLSNSNVSVAIPGSSSVSQVMRYVACSRPDRWSEEELTRIRQVVQTHRSPLNQVFQT